MMEDGKGRGEKGAAELKIRVFCYEGYRGQESPRAFLLGDRRVEVDAVVDRWRGEDHEYLKLAASDGNVYILRHDRGRDEWELYLMEAPRKPPDPRGASGGS